MTALKFTHISTYSSPLLYVPLYTVQCDTYNVSLSALHSDTVIFAYSALCYAEYRIRLPYTATVHTVRT